MAIDKRRTAPWVKVVIVLVALAFVAAPVAGFVSSRSLGGASDATGGQTDAFTRIAQQYAGRTAANENALASEPTSYTLLVNQGNAYFDWAADVQGEQALANVGGDRPIWLAAADYYKRALDVKAGDANVGTDLAIAYYYSGRTAEAIETIEAVIESSPEFASARFNAGIFYKSAGRNAEAATHLQKYLELDPQGTSGSPDSARQWLGELGSSAPATSTP